MLEEGAVEDSHPGAHHACPQTAYSCTVLPSLTVEAQSKLQREAKNSHRSQENECCWQQREEKVAAVRMLKIKGVMVTTVGESRATAGGGGGGGCHGGGGSDDDYNNGDVW